MRDFEMGSTRKVSRSVGGGIYALLVFGIGLVVAPIVIGVLGRPVLGHVATGVMLTSGVLFSAFSSTLIVVAKLYVRTRANEAIVRTGRGGIHVIKDGGAIVIPMIHEIVPVSLETTILSVKREGGEGALITRDKLRADIEAQFYLKVQPQDDDIKAAARSLGTRMGDERAVRALVEDKLISALRNAATVRTLEELNSDREGFLNAVENAIKGDLAHNGLTLESVTISKLDQTDPATLRENNIFDAQGLRTIAEITQRALTDKNLLMTAGERERERQNVDTKKQLLGLQQEQSKAEAEQAAQVASVVAENGRLARERQIEAEKAVQIATQKQQQAVAVATQEKERAIQVAVQEKDKAVQIATQDRERAVEVAMREKQAAIAEAEKAKALKEAERSTAEAGREREAQAITMVAVQAEAERRRTVEVIQAQAAAQQKKVAAEQAADAAAYAKQKDAEAQRTAAVAQAEATRQAAEAAAAAQLAKARAEAEGKLAIANATRTEAMIPVDVNAAQVDVEKKRVDVKAREVEVLQQELEARAAHGQAAQDFELAKLRIVQEATVRIEGARALAQMHGKIETTVVSTAEDMAKMNTRYLQGLGFARMANGFLDGADEKVLDGAGDLAAMLRALLQRIASPTAAKSAIKVEDGNGTAS